jgi:hypothetical protein
VKRRPNSLAGSIPPVTIASSVPRSSTAMRFNGRTF